MGNFRFGKPLRVVGLTTACGLALLSMPASASAATTSATKSAAAVGSAAHNAASLAMWNKPKNKFNGCIDSTQQNNEKFVAYVPEPGQLWIWKENRGGGDPVNPWVQFTETADDGTPVPVPEGIVCATITAHGNDIAVTVVTQSGDEQQVWQSDCTINPDNAGTPFDPNGTLPNGDARCTDFTELTPLPTDDSGSGAADEGSRRGPATGDGATATGPGAASAAGGALLGLAAVGTLAMRRRRLHGRVES